MSQIAQVTTAALQDAQLDPRAALIIADLKKAGYKAFIAGSQFGKERGSGSFGTTYAVSIEKSKGSKKKLGSAINRAYKKYGVKAPQQSWGGIPSEDGHTLKKAKSVQVDKKGNAGFAFFLLSRDSAKWVKKMTPGPAFDDGSDLDMDMDEGEEPSRLPKLLLAGGALIAIVVIYKRTRG